MQEYKVIQKIDVTDLSYMDGEDDADIEGIRARAEVITDADSYVLDDIELAKTLDFNYREVLVLLQDEKAKLKFICTSEVFGFALHEYAFSKYDDTYILIEAVPQEGGLSSRALIDKSMLVQYIVRLYDAGISFMQENDLPWIGGYMREKFIMMKDGIQARYANDAEKLEIINTGIGECDYEENLCYFLNDFKDEYEDLCAYYSEDQLREVFQEIYDRVLDTDEVTYVAEEIVRDVVSSLKTHKVVSLNIKSLITGMIEYAMSERGYVKAGPDFYRDDIKKIIWSVLAKEKNVDFKYIEAMTDTVITEFTSDHVSVDEIAGKISNMENFRDVPSDIMHSVVNDVFDFLVEIGFIGVE